MDSISTGTESKQQQQSTQSTALTLSSPISINKQQARIDSSNLSSPSTVGDDSFILDYSSLVNNLGRLLSAADQLKSLPEDDAKQLLLQLITNNENATLTDNIALLDTTTNTTNTNNTSIDNNNNNNNNTNNTELQQLLDLRTNELYELKSHYSILLSQWKSQLTSIRTELTSKYQSKLLLTNQELIDYKSKLKFTEQQLIILSNNHSDTTNNNNIPNNTNIDWYSRYNILFQSLINSLSTDTNYSAAIKQYQLLITDLTVKLTEYQLNITTLQNLLKQCKSVESQYNSTIMEIHSQYEFKSKLLLESHQAELAQLVSTINILETEIQFNQSNSNSNSSNSNNTNNGNSKYELLLQLHNELELNNSKLKSELLAAELELRIRRIESKQIITLKLQLESLEQYSKFNSNTNSSNNTNKKSNSIEILFALLLVIIMLVSMSGISTGNQSDAHFY